MNTIKIFLILGLMLVSFQSEAQVTISSNSFPKIGDTLFFGNTNNFDSIGSRRTGANVIWDFSNIVANQNLQYIYKDPSQSPNGTNFPSASILFYSSSNPGNESFLRADQDALLILGGSSSFNFVPAALKYQPPIPEVFVPSSIGDRRITASVSRTAFSSAVLPDSILDQLPIKPDSFRISLNWADTLVFTGEGIVKLPSKDIPAVQFNHRTKTTFGIEIFLPFFGWTDITGTFPGAADLSRSINQDIFYSPDYRGLIAAAFRGGGIQQSILQFRLSNKLSVFNEKGRLEEVAQLFPIPADKRLELSFNNPVTLWDIKIFDLQGKEVWKGNAASSAIIELSSWTKGFYIINIENKKGERFSGRFLKI